MDFLESAAILVPALADLPVTIYTKDQEALFQFESNYCFLTHIQTMYTAKGLASFFEKKGGQNIYMLSDALETHATIINADSKWLILGPYVTSSWQETNAKIILANCGAKKSSYSAYKIYYCKLPQLEHNYIIKIATLLLTHTTSEKIPFSPVEIIMTGKKSVQTMGNTSEKQNEGQSDQIHAWRQQFKQIVSKGDAERALQHWSNSFSLVPEIPDGANHMRNYIAGAATLRNLVREAALQAGLTPEQIDPKLQDYAHKMCDATDPHILFKMLDDFIFDFCKLISGAKNKDYSRHIRRTLDYIDAHLSQSITIEDLCQINKISRAHFAHLFSKETGTTVAQYIMQARCKEAAELLENSTLPVHEISRYVGYEDSNYFAKIFKRQMGLSPREYRRKKMIY